MRNDAIRQSLSHDPAKAIPFVLHSITTTSSASLLSHQQLPHLSLPPLTCLPPHPSLSFACCFPSPAFLCPLLSSPVSCLARPLPRPSLASHVSCLACPLPCTSLASPLSFLAHRFPLPVPCLAHLLPHPSLSLPVSCLTCLFPHVTAFPCPSLSFARHLPHVSLASPFSSHMCHFSFQ